MVIVNFTVNFCLRDYVEWNRELELLINDEVRYLLEERLRVAALSSTGINQNIQFETIA